MKKTILLSFCMLLSVAMSAKDIKTLIVKTNPVMHCENCETKIKHNLRNEKGITGIETSIREQQVKITYDAEKNTAENIISAFGKFGYRATDVHAAVKDKKCGEKRGTCMRPKAEDKQRACCKDRVGEKQCKEGTTCQKEGKGCCKENNVCTKDGKACDNKGAACPKDGKKCANDDKSCSKKGTTCAKKGTACKDGGRCAKDTECKDGKTCNKK
ncbi:MAG: heavy metal-associated domain-containing protein [Prevotellaceae bacterium]|nr:heavy metal-associated domain-containing protein [Prevotellaceae bacterium]MDY6131135.1 heavy metal-associated domain-containing protein [Prevotella sp.]